MNPAVVHVFNWREHMFSKLGYIDMFNVWRKTKVLTATLKVTVSVAVAVSVAVTVDVDVIVSWASATNLGRKSNLYLVGFSHLGRRSFPDRPQAGFMGDIISISDQVILPDCIVLPTTPSMSRKASISDRP